MEATEKAVAHSSTACETSADDSRDGWYAPAKVRDSRGAQWTYFPSTISGSNVPEGAWPFTLGTLMACSLAHNVVAHIHAAIHFVSTVCSANIVLLTCTHGLIVDHSSDTLSATHNISCSKQGSITVRDSMETLNMYNIRLYTPSDIYFVNLTLTEILQFIISVI